MSNTVVRESHNINWYFNTLKYRCDNGEIHLYPGHYPLDLFQVEMNNEQNKKEYSLIEYHTDQVGIKGSSITVFENMDEYLCELKAPYFIYIHEKTHSAFYSHCYSEGATLEAFLKGNEVHVYTSSNRKKYVFSIKGKYIPNPVKTDYSRYSFFTQDGNTIMKNTFSQNREASVENLVEKYNSLKFSSSVFHYDEKEIEKVEQIDVTTTWDLLTPPDINVLLITFKDETKRIVSENVFHEEVFASPYFNDLNFRNGFVEFAHNEFKIGEFSPDKKFDEETEDYFYDGLDNQYIVSGVSFNYSLGYENGVCSIRNDGKPFIKPNASIRVHRSVATQN